MTQSGSSTKTVDEITKERGATYGPFGEQSRISQDMQRHFKVPFEGLYNCEGIDPEAHMAIREGIAMICLKLSRLARGDLTHLDTWDDIAGYAKITAREIRRSRGEEVEY